MSAKLEIRFIFMHASSCKNDSFKYDILFLKEVNQLRSLFLVLTTPQDFLIRFLKRYGQRSFFTKSYFSYEKGTDFEMCFVKIPYAGIHLKWFANRFY